jgi:acetyl esterase/lipase
MIASRLCPRRCAEPVLHVRRLLIAVVLLQAGCSGTQLLNTLTPTSGYRFASDIPFDRERKLTLDVYTPVVARNEPVVVFFYGGRWREGAPADYRFVGQALAAQGFVAVLPDTRHYPQVKFPAFVEDAARAVRWTKDQIARYGGDRAKMFLMGHSSGAHVAALLALNREYLDAAGVDRDTLKGMIGLAGAYDFLPLTAPDLRDLFGPPERFELSQPVSFADGANPPLLLLHGADDDTVRVRNTQSLAAAVARAGGPVETVIYPQMGHAWIISTLAAPLRGRSDVLEQVAGFVRRQAAAPPRAGIISTPRPSPVKP